MNAATLDRQVERQIESLRREFAGEIPVGRVNTIGHAYYDDLRADARILEFIPLLVYRYAHEELLRSGQDELPRRAPSSTPTSRGSAQYA